MKANEAPEKIYIHVKGNKVTNTWNSEWIGVHDVEYTCTDAFIEKACKWLRKGGNGWYLTTEFGENEIDFVKLAEDFRKAMEDE